MDLPTYVVPVWMSSRNETWYKCMLCDPVTPYGNSMAIQRHLSSSFHNNTRMQQEALFCKVCNLQCKYPSHYKAHVISRGHRLALDPTLRPELKCQTCSVQFRSYKEQTRHLATNKHAKNVSKTDSCATTTDNSVQARV